MEVGHTEVLGEGTVHTGNYSTHRPPLLGTVVVSVVAYHHRVLQRDLDCPWFSTKFRIHLNGDLGSHGHQTLGLTEHRAGDALAGDGLLDATLLLDSGVMITLQRDSVLNIDTK